MGFALLRMRIIFMGTPEFAVASLEILVDNGINIVGVITAPDKPKGRGKVMQGSAVKEYAASKGLNILQPTKLKSEIFLDELRALKADLQIVVAFRMLPELVWNMPQLGTFNLHGSLLPQYRGAAPINWAIINGEEETGVTTFFLKHKIDTGSIIFQEKEAITQEDNVGTVYERLMHKGAKLVLKTVNAIASGSYTLSEQDEAIEVNEAPKIFKETCEINWNQTANKIYDFVRGLSPYPASWAILNQRKYKIYKVAIVTTDKLAPNDIDTDSKTYVNVGSDTKSISILELQPEGKKKMNIQDFLRGNKI